MSKLYFNYGTMGSSKTAQALMCKFNYEQKGFKVYLFKPIVDNRLQKDGKSYVGSRIGLVSECIEFTSSDNFLNFAKKFDFLHERNIVIVDECQFLTKDQVEQLKEISFTIPVLCYGLLTNFKTNLFEGSKRLVEIADSIREIKSVCVCGRKATVNARLLNGKVIEDGEEVLIGGDEKYQGMCYQCYLKSKRK